MKVFEPLPTDTEELATICVDAGSQIETAQSYSRALQFSNLPWCLCAFVVNALAKEVAEFR